MKYRRWWCNCKTPTCWLDCLSHALFVDWTWICDRHDEQMWRRAGEPPTTPGSE